MKSSLKPLMASSQDNWETPEELYSPLHREFGFDTDAAASPKNTKCGAYWTTKDDGLTQDWVGRTVWCNPPYGRGVSEWLDASLGLDCTAVYLLPARTDTAWFHKYAPLMSEIRFLAGRVRFVGAKASAPFPSLLMIYRPEPLSTGNRINGRVWNWRGQ